MSGSPGKNLGSRVRDVWRRDTFSANYRPNAPHIQWSKKRSSPCSEGRPDTRDVMIFMNYYGSYSMLNSILMVFVRLSARLRSLFHSILASAWIVTTAKPKKQSDCWRYFNFCVKFFKYSLKKQSNCWRYFNFENSNVRGPASAATETPPMYEFFKYSLKNKVIAGDISISQT